MNQEELKFANLVERIDGCEITINTLFELDNQKRNKIIRLELKLNKIKSLIENLNYSNRAKLPINVIKSLNTLEKIKELVKDE